MRVLVSGSSGLVGSAVCKRLASAGHQVVRLVRNGGGEDAVLWQPAAGTLDDPHGLLAETKAVIHLAGENIAAKRWSAAQKEKLRSSRVEATQGLAQALLASGAQLDSFLCASAIGFYGNRGSEELDETSTVGSGFLPELCVAWERASEALEQAGVRVCHMRLGIVLSRDGGALAKMLLPFKLGLGGKLGPGTQYMSWISLAAEVRAIEHCIHNDAVSGAVNLVGPKPVTNLQFTHTLGDVLGRPTFMAVPTFLARLVFGREMADEMMLASCRALPKKLEETGFLFQHNDIEGALRAALK